MRSLFSPIMEMLSGTNKPTSSSYIMKKHFPFICNLEKYDFSNREMGYNNGWEDFMVYFGSCIFPNNCASSVLKFLGFK